MTALLTRIRGSLRFDTGDPLVMLVGPGTEDCLVDPDYQERAFDEALVPFLRAAGYRQVVFSSVNNALYWLDRESAEVIAKRVGDPARWRERPLDAFAMAMLDECMRQRDTTTAVVILRAESFLQKIAGDRDLSETFAAWFQPSATFDNLCVLVSSGRSADTFTELARSLKVDDLVSYLERQSSRRVARAITEVGEPDVGEMERIILRQWLLHGQGQGQRIRWLELDRMAAALAAQQGVLGATWMRRLRGLAQSGSELSLDALRSHGWIESLPSGRSAWDRLCELTGLTEVKEHIDRLRWRAQAEASRRHAGVQHEPDSLHMVFTGGPGTGKTTVARLVGELYREMGLLRRGHVHAPEASELIGMYVGHTAVQTSKAVDAALDGVLFIDEAYRLSEQPGGFGQEAIDTLVTRMDNERDRLVVIVAGYPDKMDDFLRSNPGLPRRFPRGNIIEFPDYDPGELLAILLGMLRSRGLSWAPDLEDALRDLVGSVHAARDQTFGNAGDMRNLAQEIETSWARRVRAIITEPLTVDDVPGPSLAQS